MGKGNAYRIAKPIMKIAVTGTAISVAVMLLSVFIVKGFQEQIRNKVVGFGGHIQITAIEQQKNNQSDRLYLKERVVQAIKNTKDVKHVHPFALQPGIIETDEGLQGVVLKGVDGRYDWRFIKNNLVYGDSFQVEIKGIVLSETVANKLRVKLNDKIRVFAVTDNQQLKPRSLVVSAIFKTGLEDLDNQMVFVPLSMLQKINKWGMQTTLKLDTLKNTITARIFGGKPPYEIVWSNPDWTGVGPHAIDNQSLRVYATDQASTVPDTAFYDAATHTAMQGKGTDSYYVGGYEVLIHDYEKLFELDEILYDMVPFNARTSTILDTYPEIFSWLNMLDANVAIILIIMAIVVIINLSSTLLILILEKTQAIGLFKAIGATQWSIRSIFLYQANFILMRGLIIGNLIAFSLAFLQINFHILKLDTASYFISEVPISFPMSYIIAVNVCTYLLSLLLMIIPAQLIARISPVKAIKFN